MADQVDRSRQLFAASIDLLADRGENALGRSTQGLADSTTSKPAASMRDANSHMDDLLRPRPWRKTTVSRPVASRAGDAGSHAQVEAAALTRIRKKAARLLASAVRWRAFIAGINKAPSETP